ncbi:MAG: methyltransferase domain-containing protein [Candidatus Heimdallarchaeota archaeon]|nr:methyltransferase domain-containing protein [Candidatus Heimdallarchaeota archaeon]
MNNNNTTNEEIPEIPGVDPEKTQVTPFQQIVIEKTPDGSIIDIGAGGEGVIAQIGGKRVTAIDKRQDEIDEAIDKAPDANWMVADALNLPFEAEEFDGATSFFCGMYMSNDDKRKSIQEIYRVLKPGGEFWIWDSKIDIDKEQFIIMLTISLPDKEKFNTGYGTRKKDQDEEMYKEYLIEAGFSVEEMTVNKYWFFIRAKK